MKPEFQLINKDEIPESMTLGDVFKGRALKEIPKEEHPSKLVELSGLLDVPVKSFLVEENYHRFSLSRDLRKFVKQKNVYTKEIGTLTVKQTSFMAAFSRMIKNIKQGVK